MTVDEKQNQIGTLTDLVNNAAVRYERARNPPAASMQPGPAPTSPQGQALAAAEAAELVANNEKYGDLFLKAAADVIGQMTTPPA